MEVLKKIVRFLLGKGEYHIPSKNEIANLIDARLGSDNGRDDGKIIRITREPYQYYITRSPLVKRERH
jgi:hypothetical protein